MRSYVIPTLQFGSPYTCLRICQLTITNPYNNLDDFLCSKKRAPFVTTPNEVILSRLLEIESLGPVTTYINHGTYRYPERGWKTIFDCNETRLAGGRIPDLPESHLRLLRKGLMSRLSHVCGGQLLIISHYRFLSTEGHSQGRGMDFTHVLSIPTVSHLYFSRKSLFRENSVRNTMPLPSPI
jgi:hypothetical protein